MHLGNKTKTSQATIRPTDRQGHWIGGKYWKDKICTPLKLSYSCATRNGLLYLICLGWLLNANLVLPFDNNPRVSIRSSIHTSNGGYLSLLYQAPGSQLLSCLVWFVADNNNILWYWIYWVDLTEQGVDVARARARVMCFLHMCILFRYCCILSAST